jgi:hypothetical protein
MSLRAKLEASVGRGAGALLCGRPGSVPVLSVLTPEPKKLKRSLTPASASELLCASDVGEGSEAEEVAATAEDEDNAAARKRLAAAAKAGQGKKPRGRPRKRPAAAQGKRPTAAQGEPGEPAQPSEPREPTKLPDPAQQDEDAAAHQVDESSGATVPSQRGGDETGGDDKETHAQQDSMVFKHEPKLANKDKMYQPSEYFFIAGRSSLKSSEARAAWQKMPAADRAIWKSLCAKHNASVKA